MRYTIFLTVLVLAASPSIAAEMICNNGKQLYVFEDGRLHLTVNDGDLRRSEFHVLLHNGQRVVSYSVLNTTAVVEDLDFARKLKSFALLGIGPIEDQSFKVEKCR